MHALAAREEQDYRLIYLCEDLFRMRLSDIYLGCCQTTGAPFFDRIIDELWDFMALLYVETIKGTPMHDQVDWAAFRVIQETGDPEIAMPFMLRHADRRFIEMFHRDVYLFLIENQINFFMRHKETVNDPRFSYCINSPIVEVW